MNPAEHARHSVRCAIVKSGGSTCTCGADGSLQDQIKKQAAIMRDQIRRQIEGASTVTDAFNSRPPAHGGYPGAVSVRRPEGAVPKSFALDAAAAYFLGCKCRWDGLGEVDEFHPHCPVGPDHRGWPFGRGHLVAVMFTGENRPIITRLNEDFDVEAIGRYDYGVLIGGIVAR